MDYKYNGRLRFESYVSLKATACIRIFLEKFMLDTANQKFSMVKELNGKDNRSRKKYSSQ